MRSLSGAQFPDKAADPIIVHPDVRRMLLTQKAFSEGGRMFAHSLAMDVDTTKSNAPDEDKAQAEQRLALLTPIAKAFMTETGFESANLGLQIFGGHGYIVEWGMEQNVRDARIAMLYEGTTGIQALDLLGRKVVATQGGAIRPFLAEIEHFCESPTSCIPVTSCWPTSGLWHAPQHWPSSPNRTVATPISTTQKSPPPTSTLNGCCHAHAHCL